MDAAAEEGLFGERLDEDDAGWNEDGVLVFGVVRDGHFNEGLRVILLHAFEAQAAFGHVLASNDVVFALGVADARGVADLHARMLAAIAAQSSSRMIDAGSGGGRSLRSESGVTRGRRRDGKDGGGRLPQGIAGTV